MKVLIRINNFQFAGDERQEITDTVSGELFTGENEFSLCYPDKNLGGQTTVTVSGSDFVSVNRVNSGYNTEMIFEKGRTRPFVYATPYGEIMLETKTDSVLSLVERNGGFIEFEYDLMSGGEKQSRNRMRISFSEEKDV